MHTNMYSATYEIPGDVQVEVNGSKVTVSGKGKVNVREFKAKHVEIKKDANKLTVLTQSVKRADRADVGTVMGHIKNMVKGIEKGYVYKMKAVYAHFPMTIKVTGDKLTVDNFLGEKKPREMNVIKGVDIKIQGQEITLTGVNKEDVGLCTAQIEQLCRVNRYDRRIFQDGIYIIEKDGKPLK